MKKRKRDKFPPRCFFPIKSASQSKIYTTILLYLTKSKVNNKSVIKRGRMASLKLWVISLVKNGKDLMEGKRNYSLK